MSCEKRVLSEHGTTRVNVLQALYPLRKEKKVSGQQVANHSGFLQLLSLANES